MTRTTAIMTLQSWRNHLATRSNGVCETNIEGVCTLFARHAHRVAPGPLDPEFGLALCNECEMYIVTHPAESYRQGWLRRNCPRPGDAHYHAEGE